MRKIGTLLSVIAIFLFALAATSPALAEEPTGTLLVKSENNSGAYSRGWTWTIDKTGSTSALLLSPGESATVNYAVTVSPTPVNGGWTVSGNVHITNLYPDTVTVNSFSVDLGGGNVAAPTNCTAGFGFPPNIPAGYTVNCTYTFSGTGALPQTAVTTAVTNVGTFTHSAPVTLVPSGSETDECVTVTDSVVGTLGTVCASSAPATFNYSLSFGTGTGNNVVLTCGESSHPNIASFVTNDTGTKGQDTWTVNTNVACGGSCTLTQGYWKTHSQLGPAKYDPAWTNIGPLQEQTIFFLSGQTWYQVFNTPVAGNAYYNLAHQYMAAKLNVLDGATAPAEVLNALSSAEALFNVYAPAGVNNSNKSQFISLAGILDSYNNGLIGPGHCAE